MEIEPHPHPDIARDIRDLTLRLRKIHNKHELLQFSFAIMPRPEQHPYWCQLVQKIGTDACDTVEDFLIAFAEELEQVCIELEYDIVTRDCARLFGLQPHELQPMYNERHKK